MIKDFRRTGWKWLKTKFSKLGILQDQTEQVQKAHSWLPRGSNRHAAVQYLLSSADGWTMTCRITATPQRLSMKQLCGKLLLLDEHWHEGMEGEHIVIFTLTRRVAASRSKLLVISHEGWAVGAGTGAGAEAGATLAMEAGDTLTDLILPYLKYAPPPRVVSKLRPHGWVFATCRPLVREHGYCSDCLLWVSS